MKTLTPILRLWIGLKILFFFQHYFKKTQFSMKIYPLKMVQYMKSVNNFPDTVINSILKVFSQHEKASSSFPIANIDILGNFSLFF